ncbi:hypothetical protein M413DRAFT_428169 [Hebeloma cylindrosporum]|uniref:DUF6532 domain-containing protein n=1 Tax=Hebeloma cylindrosporum TaxID=76867 RepID=A0A0C3BV52_HEBCY|nr:hypothetical protein M413DRAFT_428169 [Hebeloma cylindrosporum h7]
MADRPKRSAVTNRDPTDKLLENRKRRSSAQVQQDKQTAATTSAAAEVEKINLESQKKRRIAAFEDQLRKEDQQREKNMARPDLVPQAAHHARKPTAKQQNAPVIPEKIPNLKIVQSISKVELAKSKNAEPESGSDEDERLGELEQRVPGPSELEYADIGPGELDYMSSEGLADIPDESVVDTESSDGHFGLNPGDMSDGDHEKDEDYVMDSDDGDKVDSDVEFDLRSVLETTKTQKPSNAKEFPNSAPKSKNADKPKRGDFRKAIDNVRNTVAVAGNTSKMKPLTAQKRKEPDNKAVGPVVEKRAKKTEGGLLTGWANKLAKQRLETISVVEKRAKKTEGGLLTGWANKLAKQRLETISARNASSREAVEDQEDPLEYAGGEFDEDEPIESVKAARDMKRSTVSVRGNRLTTVKVIEPVASETSSTGRRVKKVRYTFSSLPFPRGAASTTYTRDWRKAFKSTLIHWAATLEDPFGTNSVMDDIVTEIWKAVFPSIANEVDGTSRDAIIHVAADALTDWRSAMGKEGLRLVRHALKEEGVTQDDAADAVEYYLENYRFIYQNPDDDTGNKGAFLSPLVSTCLAVHLKKTIHNVKQYGYPVGALAMATAVLERGLDLIKAGHVTLDGTDADVFDDDTASSKKRKINRYAGFTDAAWGAKTRGWASAVGRLDSVKWTTILQAAVGKLDWSADEGDVDEDANSAAFDPRSLIEICNVVPRIPQDSSVPWNNYDNLRAVYVKTSKNEWISTISGTGNRGYVLAHELANWNDWTYWLQRLQRLVIFLMKIPQDSNMNKVVSDIFTIVEGQLKRFLQA